MGSTGPRQSRPFWATVRGERQQSTHCVQRLPTCSCRRYRAVGSAFGVVGEALPVDDYAGLVADDPRVVSRWHLGEISGAVLHPLTVVHLDDHAPGYEVPEVLSKLRRGLGPQIIDGRSSLRLMLQPDAWVDVEAAEKAVHKAESRLALQDWVHAWGPALAALFITDRVLLPDDETPWIDERRRWLDGIHRRALEAYALAALRTGGTELTAAVRAARQLIGLAPLRETGYQVLMEALAAQGNVAEALLVHADLCRALRDKLGVSPSAATQSVYQALLHT
jgi:hypothetical protein